MLSFYPLICGYRDWKRNTLWFITGAAISVFTLLDAVKIESLTQINIASGLIVLTALSGFLHLRKQLNSYTTTVFICQILLVILMVLATNKSIVSLQNRTGLPRDAQVAGWVILVVSLLLMPLIHYMKPNNNYKVRMLIIFLTFAPTFIILTISFESFFYLVFSAYIVQWIEISQNLRSKPKYLAL